MIWLQYFTYAAIAIAFVAMAVKALRYLRAPTHFRWELYPVPHEKGRSKWGGSYLEEFEWWKKPREKSLINEALYMFKEIVFLKGVWAKNKPLWIFSFPFPRAISLLESIKKSQDIQGAPFLLVYSTCFIPERFCVRLELQRKLFFLFSLRCLFSICIRP